MFAEDMTAAHERFAGGTAVVTGAGGGIGEGIARAAAAAGMKLVLADIAAGRIEALAAELRSQGGEAIAVRTDVRDADAMDALAAAAQSAFGDVTLLVNNAGIEVLGQIWDLSADTWQRAIDINVMGVVHGVRSFAPAMLAADRPAWIANLSSVGGLGMMPSQTAYIMSKHAILSFTECLALEMELTGKPISVSAVLPGPVATRIFDDAPASTDGAAVAGHRAYMQRMLQEHGMQPTEAGHIILDGIAKGQFWVSTHPEMMAESARARADYLATLARPALTPATRAILE